MPGPGSPADRLRTLLAEDRLYVTPSCFDALSAKMIERAGFDLAFMSGFAVSAARLGMPDTGLISYGEILDTGRNVCDAVDIPVIGDADTGYGNEMNVRRTIEGYARAGFAAAMPLHAPRFKFAADIGNHVGAAAHHDVRPFRYEFQSGK